MLHRGLLAVKGAGRYGPHVNEMVKWFARVGAAAGVADEATVTREIAAACEAGVAVAPLREVLLQSYLFVGYPRAINALLALNRVLGVEDAPGEPGEPTGDLESWRRRGEELCRRIYGRHYDRLQANIRSLHPDLAHWMVVEGYGKVLSRPMLPPHLRELAVLGILAADGQLRQLASHVRGALHVGATPSQVQVAVGAVADLSSPERARAAASMVERILEEEAA